MKINAKEVITPKTLYIVATPIGNLADISGRAIHILSEVNYIACEDTRHSKFLLKHFAIQTPLLTLHDHNEEQACKELISKLLNEQSIALISDAGTPLINDPGYHLVKTAHENHIKVVPIPGPSAFIAALSASGLPTDRFVFEGFLPAKKTARINFLNDLKNESRTLIFYETPHRILESLEDLKEVFGGFRKVTFARELTKKHEIILTTTLTELLLFVHGNEKQQKGEIVLIIKGASPIDLDNKKREEILITLLEALPLKKAVEIAAKIVGGYKNELYAKALSLKKEKK